MKNLKGGSPWIEGWVCGYTDHELENSGETEILEVPDELFRHLKVLSIISSHFLAVVIGMMLGMLWAFML